MEWNVKVFLENQAVRSEQAVLVFRPEIPSMSVDISPTNHLVREHLKMSDVEVAFHLDAGSLAGAQAQQGPCSVLTTSEAGASHSFQGSKAAAGGWEAPRH